MKARPTFYVPDALPDIPALTARYERLILMVKILLITGDYSGVLKTSLDLRRAAKALIKGKVRAAATERKLQMLLCPKWRARVIEDLGGMRKLALWTAAMKRAVVCAREYKHRWEPESKRESGYIPPHIIAARAAQDLQMAKDRAHAKLCAKACVNPGIFKDPFRVDFDGYFRLPPVPRAPGMAGQTMPAREYVYDARPVTKMTGIYAPAPVWPAEFYAAERGDFSRETSGRKRQAEFLNLNSKQFDENRLRGSLPEPTFPHRQNPVFAPP